MIHSTSIVIIIRRNHQYIYLTQVTNVVVTEVVIHCIDCN